MPALRVTTARLAMAAALTAAVAVPVQAQDSSNLVYQVQALLEEVRELRGLVESQQRELENLRRRQRDQYLDLDQRLQQLGQGSSAVDPAAIAPVPLDEVTESLGEMASTDAADSPPVSDVPEVRAPIDAGMEVAPLAAESVVAPRDLGTPTEQEQVAYDRAFRALREQRYADAAEGFSTFLDRFPESGYSPNALYWLAETYYVTRDFETALRFFEQLRERYPDSTKDGDALLKIGFSHFELRQWTEARAALEEVRSEHSGTTLARLAESRLRDMRLAGHF
ncbi:MAG: tol-pal system protein YbgF [Wenzhouxiangella sp.]